MYNSWPVIYIQTVTCYTSAACMQSYVDIQAKVGGKSLYNILSVEEPIPETTNRMCDTPKSYPADGTFYFRHDCGAPVVGKYVSLQSVAATQPAAFGVNEIEVFVQARMQGKPCRILTVQSNCRENTKDMFYRTCFIDPFPLHRQRLRRIR